jgi:hypothetical protein
MIGDENNYKIDINQKFFVNMTMNIFSSCSFYAVISRMHLALLKKPLHPSSLIFLPDSVSRDTQIIRRDEKTT